MFGERRGRANSVSTMPWRGQNLEIEVAVFLEDIFAEQTRTISYHVPVYNVFGLVEQEIPKTLNVKIPAGVREGSASA
ncbi:Curved DNA-binding protein [Serratia rubidaea]|uniref:Curved DNA-binding protein n=1 Tax=Serratia rubidaea TaxID=61652 RepID=A0A4U9HS51_SERRU|nr:Curved DNA-binding protein [Serratia rubidaea]